MNQELVIVNPLEFQDWNNLVLSTQKGTFFHTSYWAQVLSESYRYKLSYFTSINSDNTLLVLVPIMEINSPITGRRAVSLPFTDFCEPIIADKNQMNPIVDEIIQYGKKAGWKTIEIRSGNQLYPDLSISQTFYGHTLKLSGNTDDLWSTFRSSTVRNIRKAVKEGVEIQICDSIDSLKKFYKLNCITRKRHGLPPQPYNFFKQIYKYILLYNKGIVVLAYYKNRVIAGAVYFHFGKKALYKYGASDNKFQKLRANNLVMWEAIKWYSQNEFNDLDFGITEQENSGLRQFKNGWGTTEKKIHYYKYDLRKYEYIQIKSLIKGFHNKVFKYLPIPVLKICGKIIYRHIG